MVDRVLMFNINLVLWAAMGGEIVERGVGVNPSERGGEEGQTPWAQHGNEETMAGPQSRIRTGR